jgi:hypothetical protein
VIRHRHGRRPQRRPRRTPALALLKRGPIKTFILRRWCRRAGIDLEHLDDILARGVRGEIAPVDMILVADVLGDADG